MLSSVNHAGQNEMQTIALIFLLLFLSCILVLYAFGITSLFYAFGVIILVTQKNLIFFIIFLYCFRRLLLFWCTSGFNLFYPLLLFYFLCWWDFSILGIRDKTCLAHKSLPQFLIYFLYSRSFTSVGRTSAFWAFETRHGWRTNLCHKFD